MKNQTPKRKEILEPSTQQELASLLKRNIPVRVEIIGSEDGFQVTFYDERKSVGYILHTQRGAIRFFKSPGTLLNFLGNLGITSVKVHDFHLCASDAYVRQNKGRHQRRLINS